MWNKPEHKEGTLEFFYCHLFKKCLYFSNKVKYGLMQFDFCDAIDTIQSKMQSSLPSCTESIKAKCIYWYGDMGFIMACCLQQTPRLWLLVQPLDY